MTLEPKKPILTEDQEQLALVRYLELLKLQHKILIFTSHGDNMRTTIGTAVKFKKLGKRKGYPDFTIVTTRGELIYIELKRSKGGITSSEQKEWIAALNTVRNVGACVCKGFDEAKLFLNLYV